MVLTVQRGEESEVSKSKKVTGFKNSHSNAEHRQYQGTGRNFCFGYAQEANE